MVEFVGKPKVIDLFAGVGGLSLGAARAGFDLALAVEWDRHAYKAHKRNFPNTLHSDADIMSLSGSDLLKAANLDQGQLDGLIGGPPCQGFSSIGKGDPNDTRNNLFGKFFELVKEVRPKFFVAENVPGLLDPKHTSTWQMALSQIADEYEILKPMKLRASDFGSATNRQRVFFIGWRKELNLSLSQESFVLTDAPKDISVSVALEGMPAIRSSWLTEEQGVRKVGSPQNDFYREKISGDIPNGVGDPTLISRLDKHQLVCGCMGTLHTDVVKTRYGSLKPGQCDSISKSIRLRSDGFCPTLRAGTNSDKGSFQAVRPIHPTSPRVISPREAARLQGFPDWFSFDKTKWQSFRMIGNSIPPLLAEHVMKTIKEQL